MTFTELTSNLETKIINSYEQGITLDDAEKLAGEFLYGQLRVSAELTKVDLDSRMRKTGVKAIRAGVYIETVSGADKKPTESQIAAIIDTDDKVKLEQEAYDKAEVNKNELERLFSVFQQAHVHFKNIAKSGN